MQGSVEHKDGVRLEGALFPLKITTSKCNHDSQQPEVTLPNLTVIIAAWVGKIL